MYPGMGMFTKKVSHRRHAELVLSILRVLLTKREIGSKDIQVSNFTLRTIQNYLRGLADLGVLKRDGKKYLINRSKILDLFDAKELREMLISIFEEYLEKEEKEKLDIPELLSRMLSLYERKKMLGQLGRKAKKKEEKIFFVEIEEEKEEGEEEGEKRKFEPILIPLASCEKPD